MPKFVVILFDQPFSRCNSSFLSSSFFDSLRFRVRLAGKIRGGVDLSLFYAPVTVVELKLLLTTLLL